MALYLVDLAEMTPNELERARLILGNPLNLRTIRLIPPLSQTSERLLNSCSLLVALRWEDPELANRLHQINSARLSLASWLLILFMGTGHTFLLQAEPLLQPTVPDDSIHLIWPEEDVIDLVLQLQSLPLFPGLPLAVTIEPYVLLQTTNPA